MPYTFEDYRRYLDDLHEEQLENDREETAEMEAYFNEQDPFYYPIDTRDYPDYDNVTYLEELDGWFEPDQADLDAAFERDLWLSGIE